MQVTIGARCWDGVRRKSLAEPILPAIPQPVEMDRFRDKLITVGNRLNSPIVKAILGYTVPLPLLFVVKGLPPFGITRALAATPEIVPVMSSTVQDKILHAFDPLINMIQSLSYPIAGVMIAGGCLFIMVGQRERGMSMLQNAALGYILVQMSPLLLKLLVGIGGGIS
ncbi:hypothetical protein [Effusibacillus pohliae]|uniref:hypothetical protein n=1 Tax=Effusibacillus pohliae TaxID=232270 RepID=UPI000376EAFC|nr:hypothetical protein [Effusibacillus pohliae]